MSFGRIEEGSDGRQRALSSLKAKSNVSSGPSPTIVYIHGIGAQPAAITLKRQYDHALFGQDVGERSRLCYWADLLHPQPVTEASASLAMSVTSHFDASVPSVDQLEALIPDETEWPDDVRERILAATGRHRDRDVKRVVAEWGHQLAQKMANSLLGQGHADLESKFRARNAGNYQARVLPAGPVRKWLMRQLTRMFLEDVNQYLFQADVRKRIQDRLRRVFVPDGGPYVVVSHGLGTVIAYDVLHEMSRNSSLDVPLWITLGSPLGIDEVQDGIERDAGGQLSLPSAVRNWKNYADPMDPVALDKTVADEFRLDSTQTISDDPDFQNLDSRKIQGFNPHSALGYIGHPDVRNAVRELIPDHAVAPTSSFVIARDIANEMAGHQRDRMPVLIELRKAGSGSSGKVADNRSEIVEWLTETVRRSALEDSIDDGQELEEARIDVLQRYVAARLTPHEIMQLQAKHGTLSFSRVWKNSVKKAFMHVSSQRVQTSVARISYGATGEDIDWAVVDTGVAADHPHFTFNGKQKTIKAQWNCTLGKPLDPDDPDTTNALDDHGHGTHVAGIIAGRSPLNPRTRNGQEVQLLERDGKVVEEPAGSNGREVELVGMAERAKLHIYKVLDRNGEGDDSYIIKALDHIAHVNEQAGRTVIHGVNLSLGGPFDAAVYGCGFSPLCAELRRLWQLGVLVCVAAGNEGKLKVNSASGELVDLNVDLSIGDPANLEEAIAVGSVNRDFPHLHGISYFSSRGPTADGRAKPDVVAPGEWIWSCNFGFEHGDLYVPDSGTSMACPHVSGMLAAFLSVRREYIGRPDEVKRLLLEHSTDLKRDRNHQGAGLPNIVKMLVGT